MCVLIANEQLSANESHHSHIGHIQTESDTLTSLDDEGEPDQTQQKTSFESFVMRFFFLAEVDEMERENAILYHHVSAFRLFCTSNFTIFLFRRELK